MANRFTHSRLCLVARLRGWNEIFHHRLAGKPGGNNPWPRTKIVESFLIELRAERGLRVFSQLKQLCVAIEIRVGLVRACGRCSARPPGWRRGPRSSHRLVSVFITSAGCTLPLTVWIGEKTRERIARPMSWPWGGIYSLRDVFAAESPPAFDVGAVEHVARPRDRNPVLKDIEIEIADSWPGRASCAINVHEPASNV